MKLNKDKITYTSEERTNIQNAFEKYYEYIHSDKEFKNSRVKEIFKGIEVGEDFDSLHKIVNSKNTPRDVHIAMADSLVEINNQNVSVMNQHIADTINEVQNNNTLRYLEYIGSVRDNAKGAKNKKGDKALNATEKNVNDLYDRLRGEGSENGIYEDALANDEKYLKFLRHSMLNDAKIKEEELKEFEELLARREMTLASDYSKLKDLSEKESEVFSGIFSKLYNEQKNESGVNLKERDILTNDNELFANSLKNFVTSGAAAKTLSTGLMIANFPTGLIIKGVVKGLMMTPLGDKITSKINDFVNKRQSVDSGFPWGKLGIAAAAFVAGGLAVGSVYHFDLIDKLPSFTEAEASSVDDVSFDPEEHERVMAEINGSENAYNEQVNKEIEESREIIRQEEEKIAESKEIIRQEEERIASLESDVKNGVDNSSDNNPNVVNDEVSNSGDAKTPEELAEIQKSYEHAIKDYVSQKDYYDMTSINEAANELGLDIANTDEVEFSSTIEPLQDLDPELTAWLGQEMPQNNFHGAGGSMDIIAAMNNLDDPNSINVGDKIKLPLQDPVTNELIGFREVEVQRGDTLSELYQAHRAEELGNSNNFIDNCRNQDSVVFKESVNSETPVNVLPEDKDKFNLMVEYSEIVENKKIDFRGAREFMFNDYMTPNEITEYRDHMSTQIADARMGISQSEAERMVDNFIDGKTNTRNAVERSVYKMLERDFNGHISNAINDVSSDYSQEYKETIEAKEAARLESENKLSNDGEIKKVKNLKIK